MVPYGLVWSSKVPYRPLYPLWSRIFIYGQIYSCLLMYGHVRSHMVQYSLVWSRMVPYGHLWSRMVTYGHVWSRMVTCGSIWYGPKRSCMVQYSPIGSCMLYAAIRTPMVCTFSKSLTILVIEFPFCQIDRVVKVKVLSQLRIQAI